MYLPAPDGRNDSQLCRKIEKEIKRLTRSPIALVHLDDKPTGTNDRLTPLGTILLSDRVTNDSGDLRVVFVARTYLGQVLFSLAPPGISTRSWNVNREFTGKRYWRALLARDAQEARLAKPQLVRV